MSKSRLMTIIPCALALFASAPSSALTLPACLDSVQLMATSTVAFSDRVMIGGIVQSGGNLTVGNDSRIGYVRVGGNLTLGDRSKVLWNAQVQGTTTLGSNASIDSIKSGAISSCALPTIAVTEGANDTTVGNGQTITLQPGIYGTITVQSRGKLILAAGTYQFKGLFEQPDAGIYVQGATDILVGSGGIQLNDRSAIVSYDSSQDYSKYVVVATNGTITLGTDLKLIGTWVAPNADIVIVQSRMFLNGAFVAHSFSINNDLSNFTYSRSASIKTNITGIYSGYAKRSSYASVAGFRIAGTQDLLSYGEASTGGTGAAIREFSKSTVPFLRDYQVPLSLRVGGGQFVDGVNTFTGRESYSISLGNISATGGLSYPISLSYLSPTPTSFSKNSKIAPTGPVGLGWNMEFPYIVSEDNGTASYLDDNFYANFGPWGGGLLVTIDGSTFHLSNDPYIKATPLGDSVSIKGWNVVFPDGTTMVLGIRDDAMRKKAAYGANVGFEVDSLDTSFTYRWDVTEIRAPLNRGALRFDWEKVHGQISYFPSAVYDRESWIKRIWSASLPLNFDTNATVADNLSGMDTVSFAWGKKGKDEVLNNFEMYGLLDTRTTLDTRYLSSVSMNLNGKKMLKWSLSYSIVKNSEGDSKRLLQNLKPIYSDSITEVGQWWMTYDTDSSGWLQSVVDPSFVKSTFQTSVNTSDPVIRDVKEPEFASPIIGSNMFPVADNSACYGDFCYLMPMYMGDISTSPRLQRETKVIAYHRVGTYFDRVLSFEAGFQGQIILGNGFFVQLNAAKKTITVWNWNGHSFESSNPFSGDNRLSQSRSSGRNSDLIEVEAGEGFFVVNVHYPNNNDDDDSRNEVIPVIRTDTGWVALNKDPNNCDVALGGHDFYQEGISGATCMETLFDKGTYSGHTDKLHISVSGNGFYTVEQEFGKISVFRYNGSRFINETPLLVFPPILKNTFLNGANAANLENWMPFSISSGNNSFSISFSSIDYKYCGSIAWSWNGKKWIADGLNFSPGDARPWIANSLRLDVAYPTNDGYVLVYPEGYSVRHYLNYSHAAELNDDRSYTESVVAQKSGDGENTDRNMDDYPVVGSSEHYSFVHFCSKVTFPRTLEEHPANDGSHYITYAYYDSGIALDGKRHGANISAALFPANHPARYGLTNIYISPNEDWMVGRAMYKGSSDNPSICDDIHCAVEYYYIPLSADKSVNGGIPDPAKWIKIFSGDNGIFVPRIVFGSGVWLTISGNASEIHTVFHPMYSTGPVATMPSLEMRVASGLTKTSLFPQATGNVSSSTSFSYSMGSYDGQNLIPESPVTTVTRRSGTSISGTEIDSYYVQNLSQPLAGSNLNWIGEVKSINSTSAVDNVSSTQIPNYRTRMNESGWAGSVVLVTPISNYAQSTYPGGAFQSHTTYQDQFNGVSGEPAVQLDVIGGSADSGYRHHAVHKSFNSKGLVAGVREGLFKDSSYKDSLLNTPLGNTLIQQMMLDGRAVPVKAQEINYASNLRDVVATWNWGVAPINSDAVFDTGVQQRPTNFDAGWTQTSQITQRSMAGDVVEAVSMPGIYGQKWSTQLHEGARGQVTASASGAARNEFAALTAEDGSTENNTEIYNSSSARLTDGRWEMGSAAGFDSSIAHTGKWSVRVENNYGPTTNIALDSILAHKDGIRVGGWAYSKGDVAPQLLTQVWKQTCSGDGCITNSFLATTEGGYKPNVWQYWTTTIPYETLKASNPGAGGYARVFFGIYGAGMKVWVDDIFASPASASVSLQTYDGQGRPSASLSANGSVTTREYNGKGAVQAVRDERGRIFGQSTTIPAGEN